VNSLCSIRALACKTAAASAPADIAQAERYVAELGVPAGSYRVQNYLRPEEGGLGTAYGNVFDLVVVGPNVKPRPGAGATAHERLSIESVLAHEIVGHRGAELAGKGFWRDNPRAIALDEAQASIRAAMHAPGLSGAERFSLLRDGVESLHSQGFRVRDARGQLYLENGQWRNWDTSPNPALQRRVSDGN
jgi:hypothetical protein